jgi:hypothetical protein
VNFTRDPIIETIITPRDGSRLLVRSSKQGNGEEFTVDAVEVVSFGQALFFRSLERPRPFLVPVADYEILEAKENRVVLKNAQFERTIKIGGGREGSLRKEEEVEETLPPSLEEELPEESDQNDRKRDRHRRRRRGGREQGEREPVEQAPRSEESKPEISKEPLPAFPHLIPPPTTLISHNIHLYKQYQTTPDTATPPTPDEPKPATPPEGDSTPISRVAVESQPLITNFSNLNDWSNYLS